MIESCTSSSTTEEHPPETEHDVSYMDSEITGTLEDENLFLRNLALFYLKLQAKHLLPSSVIQYIAEEFQNIHTLGLRFSIQKLTDSLKELWNFAFLRINIKT